MAQSYPDNGQESGPWRGPRGITRDEAETLSKQLKPRWERAAAQPAKANGSAFNAKKTLLGLNVPDEATTAFEASKFSGRNTDGAATDASDGPRRRATVAGMRAVSPGSDSGAEQRRHKQTVMGIPTPIAAEADGEAKLKKATMVGIPVPFEARNTSKQTNVGIPVPTGIASAQAGRRPDDGTLVSEQDPTTGDTMSDAVAPSTPFPPAVDSVPAKPMGATIRSITPAEVISAEPTTARGPLGAQAAAFAPDAHDDDLLAAVGAQPGAGKKKIVYVALAALAAVLLLGFVFSGSDDAEEDVSGAEAGAAAPQLAGEKTAKDARRTPDAAKADAKAEPKAEPKPKPESEKPTVQPAKAVEVSPSKQPPTRAQPAPVKAAKKPVNATPVAKAKTRDEAALQDRTQRHSRGSLPDVKARSKGALLRDPAAKSKKKTPAAEPTPTKTATPPAPRKKAVGGGTIVRDTPF